MKNVVPNDSQVGPEPREASSSMRPKWPLSATLLTVQKSDLRAKKINGLFGANHVRCSRQIHAAVYVKDVARDVAGFVAG